MLYPLKLAAILEKIAAILDFQMFTYLDLTNASNYFVCASYQASAAFINWLDKYTCVNSVFDLGDLYEFENDLET